VGVVSLGAATTGLRGVGAVGRATAWIRGVGVAFPDEGVFSAPLAFSAELCGFLSQPVRRITRAIPSATAHRAFLFCIFITLLTSIFVKSRKIHAWISFYGLIFGQCLALVKS
jgi:hypothetical protein